MGFLVCALMAILLLPAATQASTKRCITHADGSVACMRDGGGIEYNYVDVCDRDADGHQVNARILFYWAGVPITWQTGYDQNGSKSGCTTYDASSIRSTTPIRIQGISVDAISVCVANEECSDFRFRNGGSLSFGAVGPEDYEDDLGGSFTIAAVKCRTSPCTHSSSNGSTAPQYANLHDYNGDRNPDLLARKPFDGSLSMFRSNGIGGFANNTGEVIGGAGWSMFDRLFSAEWGSNEDADVIARKGDGTLWLYKGSGGGGFLNPGGTLIGGGGWMMFNSLFATDWSGDGHDDILARKPDGSLWMYKGSGAEANGGFLTGVGILVGGDYSPFDIVTASNDFSGDEIADIIARKPWDGTLWMFPGNGIGGYASEFGTMIGGGGWNMFNAIVPVGDWNGDSKDDLVARKPDGTLWLYKGNGAGGFLGGAVLLGGGWTPYDYLL
jgi:hypothetical protein